MPSAIRAGNPTPPRPNPTTVADDGDDAVAVFARWLALSTAGNFAESARCRAELLHRFGVTVSRRRPSFRRPYGGGA